MINRRALVAGAGAALSALGGCGGPGGGADNSISFM
jgi:hypothetical protein